MQDTPESAAPETILAFDFGLKRIGVAVGQSVTGSAGPAGVVDNRDDGPDIERIRRLIDEWRPTRLVVGLPVHADGTPGDMQARVRRFAERLEEFGLPVALVDERYTSIEAETGLRAARAAGRRGRISREAIDAAAAVLIAERYLAGQRTSV
jgi:putative Holliday junction resolvase